ncbi:hypothetical protein BKA82DRAFT_1002880 [Pisolithus tinctorius]|uniref:BTB domain-containing protein n=1 Tax=Pisolithus tinctorius Marx 270 TaxID=870435 RepID=A0A0C3P2N9_PISTI|nr:hypothetical protein BKA82DRAFT_1002880 [Pisolithus tinctorius]KIO01756.1 hypothetical protein M404DRAFT_1002880 [Pisolithus tinctorius Marx 270]
MSETVVAGYRFLCMLQTGSQRGTVHRTRIGWPRQKNRLSWLLIHYYHIPAPGRVRNLFQVPPLPLDNTDFRVFKFFLSFCSPVSKTHFDHLRRSEEMSIDVEIKDGIPVITVSEDKKALKFLLHFCYPDRCTPTARLTPKYSLDVAVKTMCKSVFYLRILEANPRCYFVIACEAGMRDGCIPAAEYALREPVNTAWFEEPQKNELHLLLTYRKKCGIAVQVLKNDISWIGRLSSLDSCPANGR